MENSLKVCGVDTNKEMDAAYIPKRGRPRRGVELTVEQKEQQALYKAQKLKEYMTIYREAHKQDIQIAMRDYYQLPEVKEKMRNYNRERMRRLSEQKKALENV